MHYFLESISPLLQFPVISEFGEERIVCCSCEPIIKDTSVIQSETTNLQQRINSLTQEVIPSLQLLQVVDLKEVAQVVLIPLVE